MIDKEKEMMRQNKNLSKDSELYSKSKENSVTGQNPSEKTESMSVKETNVKHFNMKKYFVQLMIVAVALTGIFEACKKDDDKDDDDSTPIYIPTDTNTTGRDTLAFTTEELQKVSTIKTMYSSIQTSFSGGYFITVPTVAPEYTIGEVKNEVLKAGVDA
ncbi:MAG: hypothetical protein LBI60_06420, partial [Bacteroidales bacterium]|nr:hypothetical protein [Bacteroidales bacterium]